MLGIIDYRKRWCYKVMIWYVCLLRMVVAVAIGTMIGVEREYKGRPAGMRTHVLVCLGACVIAMLESDMRIQIAGGEIEGVTYNFGRLTAQVISGIGFLGAGTIFTAQKKVVGLTTAASLWNTACIGLAVGYGKYIIAVAGSLFVLGTLLMMAKLVHVNKSKKVEVKFYHRVETIEFINSYFASRQIVVADIDFHVESEEGGRNLYTNSYTLRLPQGVSYTDLVNDISEHSNVLSIRTTNT